MSEFSWFCRVGDQQVGPLTLQQLRRMAAKGELKLTSLIRRQDVATWTEAGQIPDLWPRAAALPPDPADSPPLPVAPPPPPPRPAGLPVARMPVAGAPLAGVPVAVRPVQPASVRPVNAPTPVMPAAVGAKEASESPRSKQQLRREQARRKLLILVGAAGGVLLVLITVAVIMSSQKSGGEAAGSSPPSTEALAANSATAPTATPALPPSTPATTPASTPASVAPLATAPVATAPVATATGVAGGPGVAASSASSPPSAPQPPPAASGGAEFAALVASVRPWRTSTSVSSPTTRIQLAGAWFASEKPSRPQPKAVETLPAEKSGEGSAPDANSTASETTPPATTPPTSPPVSTPQFLCVELRLTIPDRATAPVNYSGWNSVSTKASQPTAFLTDPNGKPLAFIPPAQFTDALRQTKAVRLNPGQSVSDLLVFAAPQGDFEHVRLGLRMSVVGQGDRYLGFQLGREAITNERPVELAAPSPTRARPAAAIAAQEEMSDDGAAPPAADAGAKPPREETILDLKKQIEDMAKETKAAKDRERKMREEEEKKKAEKDGQEGQDGESS